MLYFSLQNKLPNIKYNNPMKPLQQNDTIGIIAPSSFVPTSLEENYKRGLEEIKKMGFQYKEGKTTKLKKWHFAGTDEERAEDINKMFSDKNIKAIICAIGGAGANRTLELLDYETIKNNPKPFMGISDPTVLLSALYQQSNTPTIHGPDVCFGFGGDKPKKEKEWELGMIKRILTTNEGLGEITPLTKWKNIKKGKGKGLLLGGHLGLYTGLLGTKYFADIKDKQKILFWETTGSYLSMDGDLTNLKNSGFFKNVNGMIIGKFNIMDKDEENKQAEKYVYELILDQFKEYNFPILADVDFGHLTPNIPLPYGRMAEINNTSFKITEGVF